MNPNAPGEAARLTSIKETSIYTDDLGRLARFYEVLLGAAPFSASRAHAFFRVGPSVLLCFDRHGTRSRTDLPRHWAEGEPHFAFEVTAGADFGRWLEKLRKAGIAIEHEQVWPGGYRSFYFRDPDRNCVEILEAGLWEHRGAEEVAISDEDRRFLGEAIALSVSGMESGEGGPFGCVIAKDGRVIGRGNNRVLSTNDPTAHAEVVAIREACDALGDFQLTGCTIYASCEPCPMCLGAIYWARPARLLFAASRSDAAEAGFDDRLIYEELPLPPADRRIGTGQALRVEARAVLARWIAKADRRMY